ncbi:putative L-xylulose reductase [Cardiosporidium cionae]|uniref:L-xylulose reductase n=1 Tax=Cardiosporidium cionae TaxID=476202 RepID=A0ABQ7J4Y4_9APIC|nr:putative L-xylulose reductase [Cardiosporidium cionae]|eukprot:KAF8819076.1 putative L-xylulose reductase [Cardiosporidium cionae]
MAAVEVKLLSGPSKEIVEKAGSWNFSGKTAVVTGASKGIGREIAVALYKANAKVFALARNEKQLKQLEKEYPGINPVVVDVCNSNELQDAMERIGDIDMLVNNAGISHFGDVLEDHSFEDFERVIATNLRAPFICIQIAARNMKKRGSGGSIVNISSVASLTPPPCLVAYCASKGGLDGLTKSFANDLGVHQIRVNSVNPTVVFTDMGRATWEPRENHLPFLKQIPLQRFAEVHDVVEPVMFLLSDKANMITGSTLPVDGGSVHSVLLK